MESNLTKILIKKILGKVCIPPPPWIPSKEVGPSPFLALTFTLPSEAPGPFPPLKKNVPSLRPNQRCQEA